MANVDYDILIVGGGMVGASQALALAPLGIRIGVVEAFPIRSDTQPSYDTRSIALSFGSRIIFESMGLWRNIESVVTPITKIHISDRGNFGVTRLSAAEEKVAALGYVIENRHLGQALVRALSDFQNVDWICPAKVESVELQNDVVVAHVVSDEKKRATVARLMIAADGGNSSLRQILDIESSRWEYGQTAIISTVTPAQLHQNIAYERFTDQGPLALLPLSDNRCSLVLTVRDADVDRVLALDDAQFLDYLNERFGYRLGAFVKVAKRVAYPLALTRVDEQVRERFAIIGNAAHTLHPIAGQGFNLGLRDVAELSDFLAQAIRKNGDVGSLEILNQYAKARKGDHRTTAAITDGLARIFSNRFEPLAAARSHGLWLTDLFPPAKHLIARRAMGFVGRLPRLARGLAL